MDLRAGQQVRLMDLVYALMLKSANDAAVVVAEGLAGSVPEFAALMNQRAREIGATNTHFHNPNGLPDDEHLTTTHDMAMILRHALTVPGFREVAGTNAKVIQIEDERIHPVALHSKNRLLNGYFVPVLGKTGYTRAAGRCFAGAAELNGRRVITVVFGASDMWGDTRKLMEYGFSTFDDTAPVVQLALQSARRNPPRTSVASARSSRRRAATSVASRGRSRTARTTTVASASSRSKAKSSAASDALARGKATAQVAARSRSASATASAARTTKSTKPGDRQAKLDTSSNVRRR
jgi:D-alanyl-D-alanine carboxypeptidase